LARWTRNLRMALLNATGISAYREYQRIME
jgi:hypothetical protein